MTANATPPGGTPDPMAELNAIADRIGVQGQAGDTMIVELAKGVKDAVANMNAMFAGLGDLLKGGKKPKAKDDDEDDEDDDTDDGGGPGYQNMQMGQPGGRVNPTGGAPAGYGAPIEGGDFDVSQFCQDEALRTIQLQKAVDYLHAENKDLRKLVTGGFQAIAQAIQAGNTAQLQASVALAKAQADARETLLNIPAAAITPAPRARVPANDALPIGGNDRREKQALAKAFRDGLIDAESKALFHQSRRFSADPIRHQATRAQLETIAKAFDTGA